MISAFGVEHHELAKRDYSRAHEKWAQRERRANVVENTGQTAAGAGGAVIGGAALRDAAYTDYPAMKAKHEAKLGAGKVGRALVHGKPGFKVLAVTAGGTVAAGLGTRSRKAAEKRKDRYAAMLAKALAEPGGAMHAHDLEVVAKAFAVDRAGQATRLLKPLTRKRTAIRVNSAGEALPTRVKVDGKGPQRKPFLHPQARSAKTKNIVRAGERFGREANEARLSTSRYQDEVKAVRAVGGTRAPEKVKRALSGADYGETISRLGRATRRQNKEFSAVVHPISGRVMDMRRGGDVATMMGVPRAERKSVKRLARLADRSRNPQVRDRAAAAVERKNPMTRGPEPVQVHNHPHFGEGARKHTRAYPSGQDLHGAAVQRAVSGQDGRHVVLTHAPGPRGSKQTKAVTTQVLKPNSAKTVESLSRHDLATQTPDIQRAAAAGDQQVAGMLREARSSARGGRRKVTGYDTYIKRKTSTPKAANKSGFRTVETLHKASGQMPNRELARRKKLQSATTIAGSTLGLGALGALGGAKLLPKATKLGKTPRGQAYARHLDRTATQLSIGAGGVGGLGGFNFASIQRAEAKKVQ